MSAMNNFLIGVAEDIEERTGEDLYKIMDDIVGGKYGDLGALRSAHHISIDNGHCFVDPSEALQSVDLDTIAAYMDDDIREQTAGEVAPCSPVEFLKMYLQLADEDLIVG